MKKYSLSILFVFILSNSLFAQQIDSMMGIYADRAAPEKIHIHFDKSVYNKGETIWYKVYLLQGRDSAATSQNLYLDWYNTEGKLITHSVLPVLLSSAQGSFEIPEKYESGLLQVKAYTRWMLNDEPDFNYLREIFINSSNNANPVVHKTTVEAFPEGGTLIQGLHSRIAFKATDQYGSPVLITGSLTDQNNNVIDSISVQHDGMGSVLLSPKAGQKYQINWSDEFGNSGITQLPVFKPEGAIISVGVYNNKANVQIERTEAVADNFKQMTLLVHMNQVTLFQVAINATQKTKLNAQIPLADLPTGVLQFTLFTSDWLPVAERVLFINNHAHEFQVSLKSNQINLDKKGKNIIDIIVPDTLFTNMSLAIADASVNATNEHSIYSDIFLSSEIKGKVYNPAYYLSSAADSVQSHLDLVMLTNAWRKFDWEKIKANIPPVLKHPVESGYMKLQGKIFGFAQKNTSDTLNLVISAKDSSSQFLFVPIEKDGSFTYPLFIYDTAKVFYSFNNKKNTISKSDIYVGNGLYNLSPSNINPNHSNPFLWNENAAREKLSKLLSNQLFLKKLMAETTLQEVTVTSKTKSKEQVLSEKYSSGFFSRNEAGLFDLTDNSKAIFTRNILEYLQSKVPGLDIVQNNVTWRGDKPVFFLNEMQVEQDMALNIDMNNIAMIKVFRPPFMFATGGGRGGAIAIYTKKGDDAKYVNDIKGLDYVLLEGYTKFKEFYSPKYESKEDFSNKPDTRTTLYWNPYIITNKTQQKVHVEFYNSDVAKSYRIVLEGINAAGKITRFVKLVE